MCKVSIIIPIYNVEKYLDKCMQSAINQTLQDIEIILVDDESPDNCPDMCDEYAKADCRVKVVHRKNGGLGFARNSGLEVATGEYVTFLDSDDFVDLYTYEHLYTLAKGRNLDAIYYDFKRFSDENGVTEEEPTNEVAEYRENEIKDLMLDIIASEPSAKVDQKVQCSSCTAMYKLDIIKEHNIRFHSERELISEDRIFNLEYLKNSRLIAFYKGRHYHYRINYTSLTNTVRADRFEKDLIMYDFLKQNITAWGLDTKRGYERCQRFIIGYSRTAVSQFLCSNKSTNEKKLWLSNVLSNPIWQELYNTFDWKKLPIYQRTFFCASAKKWYRVLLLLCKIRTIISKIKHFL